MTLFRDTVRRVNAHDYTPEQIQAWAPDELDAARWATLDQRFTVAAESDGRVVGFSDLETNGHIDRFFVHADYQRCGVGRALLAAVINEAVRVGIRRLFAEVSVTARPFFERNGFVVLAEQEVAIQGMRLTNFRMERLLEPTGSWI